MLDFTPVATVDPSSGLSGGTAFSDDKQNFDATNAKQIEKINTDLASAYKSKYNDWATNMTSGGFVPPERRTPPAVPNSWVVVVNADILNDRTQTGPPVFTLPAPLPTYNAGIVPTVAHDGAILIGPRNGGPTSLWFNALAGDGFPAGMKTPVQPDGHEYLKFNTPFGWGWYLQLAGTDGAGAPVTAAAQTGGK